MKKPGIALSIALITANSLFAQISSIDGVFSTDDPAGADFATNFFTTGIGAGFVHVRNGALVTVTITNPVSSRVAIGTADANNSPVAFSGDLVINSLDDIRDFGDANADVTRVRSDGFNQRVVQLLSGTGVTFNEGEYVGNNSRNPAIWATTELQNLGSVILNGASFRGGDSERNRGGAGLYIRRMGSTASLNINYAKEGAEDYILGGDGGNFSLSTADSYLKTQVFGGDGIHFFQNAANNQTQAKLIASNINVRGGNGGSSILTGRLLTSEAWGGKGIHNANGDVMLNGGWVYGGNGGVVTHNGESDNTTGSDLQVYGGMGLDLRQPGAGSFITNMFEVRGGDGGTAVRNGNSGDSQLQAWGGHGVMIPTFSSPLLPVTGKYYGGTGGSATANGSAGNAQTFGGTAVVSTGGLAVQTDGFFAGGNGGDAFALEGLANASAGDGFSGVIHVTDGTYLGGSGGTAEVLGSSSTALAAGGDGVRVRSFSTIDGGSFIGGAGGTASSSSADANGGAGVFVDGGSMVINDGLFQGGVGGRALSTSTSSADGGSGVYVDSGSVTINGGSFSGAAGGTALGTNASAHAGWGIFSMGGNVTLNDATGTNTVINDGIYFTNAGKKLDIQGGSINGEIRFDGTGISSFTLSTNAGIEGIVWQQGGTVNVTLSEAEASQLFKDVTINSTMSFDKAFVSAENARFSLSDTSTLKFGNALTLSSGSTLGVGLGRVSVGGNLVIDDGSSMNFSYEGWTTNATSPRFGMAAITSGSLIMTNADARLSISGAAATTTGRVELVAASGATDFGANSNRVDEVVDAELGWLVNASVDASSGITINFDYNALTNSSLIDLGAALLTDLDRVLTNRTSIENQTFYKINKLSRQDGEQLLRYTVSQQPDVADAAFQVQQQISDQIAARTTEFRSMNGYASTQSTVGKAAGPLGAAGPGSGNNDMQGWIRAYGAFSSRDADGTFADFDSRVFGTVVGMDKSFGNLLVGLAGGYARGNIDAGSTYDADVDTYHGTLYSTIGGKSAYVDLAFTYGLNKIKADNLLMDEKFDSHTTSGYIGTGRSFNITEKTQITPETSMLMSHYSQDQYQRFGGTIAEYDEWSYLGALGASFSSTHQIDWLRHGLALLPEFRVHWLHEFNADLGDFSYSASGKAFGVRSREEDLLQVGGGLDIWNWKLQSTKVEVDYDGIFGGDYGQHIVSGKVTVKF